VAGNVSIKLARRQGAHLDCGQFADLSPGDGNAEHLMTYWTTGKGAAKIRWGTDGSFARCVRQLRKYVKFSPEGLCAKLHKRATGQWPTEGGKAGIPS
jgi:hypothetical protein